MVHGWALFVERGFDEVTVDDVCAVAEVAKGTFYFHFPSKAALLAAAFQRSDDEIVEFAERLVESGRPFGQVVLEFGERAAANTQPIPKDLVRRAVLEALGHIGFGPAAEQGDSRRAALTQLVGYGRARGELLEDVATRDVVMTLGWAILQGILIWSSTDGDRPGLGDIVHNRLERALHGVVT